jgi:hypothetical protein
MMVDRAERRRTRWPIYAAAAAIVLLVAVAAAIAVPRLTTSEAPTAPSGSAAATPTNAESAPAEVADGLGDDTAWWRYVQMDAAGAAEMIQVGTLGAGPTAEVHVEMQGSDVVDMMLFPFRSVIGPRGGVVVTIGGDGEAAVLQAVDAATGDVRELARTEDVIVDAQFLAGASVLFITGDAASGDVTGAWVVDAVEGGQPAPLEGLVGAAADITLVARATAMVRLFVSPNGDVAAVHRCGPNGVCALRAVNLEDGTQYEHQLPAGDEPIGLAGEHVYLRQLCMQAFCPGELLHLETGERVALAGGGDRISFDETVVDSTDGPVLVQAAGTVRAPAPGVDDLGIAVTDMATGQTRPPIRLPLGSMRIVGPTAHDVGIEVPPGWVAVLASPPGAPVPPPSMSAFAIDLVTGELVHLPAVGEFLNAQG